MSRRRNTYKQDIFSDGNVRYLHVSDELSMAEPKTGTRWLYTVGCTVVVARWREESREERGKWVEERRNIPDISAHQALIPRSCMKRRLTESWRGREILSTPLSFVHLSYTRAPVSGLYHLRVPSSALFISRSLARSSSLPFIQPLASEPHEPALSTLARSSFASFVE